MKEWNLRLIYRGMADFMVIQCLCVILVLIFPAIAMWFRRLAAGPQGCGSQGANRVCDAAKGRRGVGQQEVTNEFRFRCSFGGDRALQRAAPA